MSDPLLPGQEEWDALVPGPESITWRRAGDSRSFIAAGYALLLQVAHPTVGAGVAEHSNFEADPWGRLIRTLDFTNTLIYGGATASAAMGRRVREIHKTIKGVKPDGEHYHALEPVAYAWVHATLAEAIVAAHERFGRPFNRDQKERFWAEWRGLGRLLGVRDRDLPEGWDEFREYFDFMAAGLERTESVDTVVRSLASPASPPVSGAAAAAWRVGRLPAARVIGLATVGLLRSDLRERFGLPWTRSQDVQLRVIGAAMRSATPLMPASLRNLGPSYLRWRGDQIAAAGDDDGPQPAAVAQPASN